MTQSIQRILLPLALGAIAPAAYAQAGSSAEGEVAKEPLQRVLAPIGPELDGAVLAPSGPWSPGLGTPDPGGVQRTDAELEALAASGVGLAPAPDPRETLHSETAEGVTWLRGRAYKARVSADGFQYVPFLGSEAPRNFPVSFRLDRASVGGRELSLTSDAEVSRDGDRFVLDRGAVEVIYDVALDTVEQSFALDVAGTAGDLVLDIDVETDLAFEYAPGGGFRFASEYGGMSYGTAVVFDGAGRQADVPASFDGAEIHLTVPAAFVASAEGPILVDPIIGTFTVADYSGDQERPDVAYDRNTDSFIHVYEDTFSGNDGDVYFRRWDSAGNFIDQGFVDFSTDNWRRPSVANIDFLNRSLIVAERTPAGTNSTEIVGRFFRYSVLALEPILLIGTADPAWNNFAPDVGGSWVPSVDGEFCVVWQRSFTGSTVLRLRIVEGNSNLGNVQALSIPGGLDVFETVISKSSGNPNDVNAWNIALRTVDRTTGAEGIWCAQLNGDGTVLSQPNEVWSQPSGTLLREIDVSESIKVDAFDPLYLVTYDQFSASPESKPILSCRGATRERVTELAVREHSASTGGVNTTGIRFATTASDFLVSYLESNPGQPFRAYLTALDRVSLDNLAVSERRTVLSTVGTSGVRGAASIASRQSGGLNSAWSQVNWSRLDASSGWDVEAARHVASNGTSVALQYCQSVPNSTGDYGFLAMYGNNQLTSNQGLVASSLPTNSVGFFVVGNGFTVLTGPGGSVGNLCVAGGSNLGRYSNQAASSGASGTLTLSIDPLNLPTQSGTVSAMAGQFWQFQCWHRDSVGGMAVSNFTNAVSARFQ